MILINILIALALVSGSSDCPKQGMQSNISEMTQQEEKLEQMGMQDIQKVDPSIAVHLVYATPDNFMGKVLYNDITKAYALPELTKKLIMAQKALKEIDSTLSLIVYDAARPISIQQQMWETVEGTDKTDFVSNPKNGGGLHNYGAAVDVTIIDSNAKPLPMGSGYDYFGDEARINNEESLLNNGKITKQELQNRLLLRKLMVDAGFLTIQSEWWHFNLISRKEAYATLKLIE